MPVVYYTKNKSKPLKAYIHVIKNRTKQLQGSLLHQDSLNIITLHNMKAILMGFFQNCLASFCLYLLNILQFLKTYRWEDGDMEAMNSSTYGQPPPPLSI